MRFLVDTNVFLEVLLGQERAEEAQAFLLKTREHTFFMSDYRLHSVGLLLFRRNRHEVFRQFLEDMVLNGAVEIVDLPPGQMEYAITAALQFDLDFDDAYQYAVAKARGLRPVSLDANFDRTDLERMTPGDVQ